MPFQLMNAFSANESDSQIFEKLTDYNTVTIPVHEMLYKSFSVFIEFIIKHIEICILKSA